MEQVMKVVAVIHARMTSSRLPGKVLKDLGGRSVFYHHYERLSQCAKIDKIYLATSKSETNDPLREEARRYGVPCYSGAEEDLLERYTSIARKEKPDAVVRCGCDKPLFSYEIVDHLLDAYDGEDLLYVTTPLGKGIGSEVLSPAALERIHEHYRGPAIAKYVFEYPHLFNTRGVEVDDEFSRPEFRLTLDTVEDYELLKTIYDRFYEDGVPVDIREVFKYLDDNPDIANINRFTEDKYVNTYLKELQERAVFSVYQARSGRCVVRNRMGEVISPGEFLEAVGKLDWEEG